MHIGRRGMNRARLHQAVVVGPGFLAPGLPALRGPTAPLPRAPNGDGSHPEGQAQQLIEADLVALLGEEGGDRGVEIAVRERAGNAAEHDEDRIPVARADLGQRRARAGTRQRDAGAEDQPADDVGLEQQRLQAA